MGKKLAGSYRPRFGAAIHFIESVASAKPRALLETWRDGRIKMFAIHRLLALRRERAELFADGAYTGIAATGAFADKVIAFERRHADTAVLVIVPRHTATLGFPPVGEVWADTCLALPAAARWRDLFTGREHRGERLTLSEVFADLPFAALSAES